MPRARCPDSIEAERLWKEERMLLKDIAAKMGVPEGTVRRWKNTQDWEGKKSERSEKGKANVRKKKRGAPKDNRNALGNKSRTEHGAYSSSRWDFIDPEERSWLDANMHDQTEAMLLEEIAMFSIRERRIMNAINRYRRPLIDAEGNEKPQDVYISGSTRTETKRRFKSKEDEERYDEIIERKVERGDRLPGEQYTIQTSTEPTANMIARLERELSTVQRSKLKAIEALNAYRAEKQKQEGDSTGNDALKAWAEAVRKKREGKGHDGSGTG